jgi:hypothetical protein
VGDPTEVNAACRRAYTSKEKQIATLWLYRHNLMPSADSWRTTCMTKPLTAACCARLTCCSTRPMGNELGHATRKSHALNLLRTQGLQHGYVGPTRALMQQSAAPQPHNVHGIVNICDDGQAAGYIQPWRTACHDTSTRGSAACPCVKCGAPCSVTAFRNTYPEQLGDHIIADALNDIRKRALAGTSAQRHSRKFNP